MKLKKNKKTISLVVIVIIVLIAVSYYFNRPSWWINFKLRIAVTQGKIIPISDILGRQSDDAYFLLFDTNTYFHDVNWPEGMSKYLRETLNLKTYKDKSYFKLIIFDSSGVLKAYKVAHWGPLSGNYPTCLKYDNAYLFPYEKYKSTYYQLVTKAEAEDTRFHAFNARLKELLREHEAIELNAVLNIIQDDAYILYIQPYYTAERTAGSVYEKNDVPFSKDFLAGIIAEVPPFENMSKLIIFNEHGIVDVISIHSGPLYYKTNLQKCMKLNESWLVFNKGEGEYILQTTPN